MWPRPALRRGDGPPLRKAGRDPDPGFGPATERTPRLAGPGPDPGFGPATDRAARQTSDPTRASARRRTELHARSGPRCPRFGVAPARAAPQASASTCAPAQRWPELLAGLAPPPCSGMEVARAAAQVWRWLRASAWRRPALHRGSRTRTVLRRGDGPGMSCTAGPGHGRRFGVARDRVHRKVSEANRASARQRSELNGRLRTRACSGTPGRRSACKKGVARGFGGKTWRGERVSARARRQEALPRPQGCWDGRHRRRPAHFGAATPSRRRPTLRPRVRWHRPRARPGPRSRRRPRPGGVEVKTGRAHRCSGWCSGTGRGVVPPKAARTVSWLQRSAAELRLRGRAGSGTPPGAPLAPARRPASAGRRQGPEASRTARAPTVPQGWFASPTVRSFARTTCTGRWR